MEAWSLPKALNHDLVPSQQWTILTLSVVLHEKIVFFEQLALLSYLVLPK